MKLNKVSKQLLIIVFCFTWLFNVTVGQASAQVEKKEDVVFFIDQIAERAKKLAEENDLYASIMLAQAILASDYGRSELSLPSVNNIFSIQGRYKNHFVKWSDGKIDDNATNYLEYRKYPSYNEALADYVLLMKEGTASDPDFYSGAWKSQTINYKAATHFLTSRYAEDPEYARRLNSVIELYNLTDFDENKADKKEEFSKVKKNLTLEEFNNKRTHKVVANETLLDIAEAYEVSLAYLIQVNHLKYSSVFVGQELVVD